MPEYQTRKVCMPSTTRNLFAFKLTSHMINRLCRGWFDSEVHAFRFSTEAKLLFLTSHGGTGSRTPSCQALLFPSGEIKEAGGAPYTTPGYHSHRIFGLQANSEVILGSWNFGERTSCPCETCHHKEDERNRTVTPQEKPRWTLIRARGVDPVLPEIGDKAGWQITQEQGTDRSASLRLTGSNKKLSPSVLPSMRARGTEPRPAIYTVYILPQPDETDGAPSPGPPWTAHRIFALQADA
ncbi:hypothetical protein C8R47DRAFT_1067552 [Mycena vitilis]|nr:hypothetical protein C8R47DRAFT_1067552 [Mycena vitilis]